MKKYTQFFQNRFIHCNFSSLRCHRNVDSSPQSHRLRRLAAVVLAACALFAASAGASPNPGTSGNSGSPLNPSASSYSFGSVQVGKSASYSIRLTNAGATRLKIYGATVSGTGFSLSGLSLPLVLMPNQTATCTASFAPKAVGTDSGTITISSTASDSTLRISLSGFGTQGSGSGVLSSTPSSANFGTVAVGSSNSQTIKLSNTGSASLTITQAAFSAAGFGFNGLSLPLTISSGGSFSFNLVFAPLQAGSVNGSLTLTSNASNSTFAISVSGTGSASSKSLSANPSSLSFGNVTDGTSSTQNVTLTNTGNANVTISSVTASGSGFSESGVSSGVILGPGQTTTMQVAFAPTKTGSVTGSVSVASDATNSPSSVSLSGTGVQGSPASTVSLSWNASSTAGVTGYNVYRGTSPGAYSKLNSSQVSATAFTDSTVQSGQGITYYYVVTAVNSSNAESPDSNMATALVP